MGDMFLSLYELLYKKSPAEEISAGLKIQIVQVGLLG